MTSELPSTKSDDRRERSSPARIVLVAVAVFASFLCYSLARSPIPGVNEPHYLCKATHYWNPEWCRGDLFLESSNPHLFFYQSIGWLTLWLPLEQTAWIGRALALGLLAAGWTALVSRLCDSAWTPLWSAWVYLLLAAIGNLSGEWIVAGVESKVFAYAFVLLAGALALDRRWNWAAATAGLAIAFHPVIGMWSLVCALWPGWLAVRSHLQSSPRRLAGLLEKGWQPWLLLALCALPGLLPALAVVRSGLPATDAIQVFGRLRHHLDPMTFSPAGYGWYAVLTVCWVAGWMLLREPRHKSYRLFVLSSLLIALAGLAVGLGPRPAEQMPLYELRAKLLKFYPFRLYDAALPIAVAILFAETANAWIRVRPQAPQLRFRRRAVWSVVAAALAISILIPSVDRNPSRMPAAQHADWIEACRFIAREVPPSAVCLTPRNSWAFKWYAERPEFFSYKDCPQDAAAILQWQRRRVFLDRWRRTALNGPYSPADVDVLRQESDVTHIVAHAGDAFPLTAIYQNASFRVYSLE